ncbi:MAG TPA: Npt1/Npt2 family nucleotide transporter [Candidatus Azoamicus sp. OHIO1]
MSDNTINQPEFSRWRKLLWPIHNYELKKFLPLGLIMFSILFNYTLLRDTKDTLVVNAAGAGVIPFLKFYCVTPAAIAFVIIYAKLCNILEREKVFYAVVTPFLIFFAAFAFIIYPNFDALHPSQNTINQLNANYPTFSGFISIAGFWSYSLFYVLSEIWGSAMIALMFWQFANEIVRINESKRFYGLFVVVGNVSLILSGQVVRFCSTGIKVYFPVDPWKWSLYFLMGTVVIMGFVAMYIYRWTNMHVLTNPKYYDGANKEKLEKTEKKKKNKPGLMESIRIIGLSKELGLIALLIMAYGVTINLVEVQWKEQLKFYYAGDKGGYNAFMGNYSTISGIITILFSLFIGSNILRIVSWFTAAVITPFVILVGGTIFFCFILSNDISLIKELVINTLSGIGTTPVEAATFLGAAIVIISKVVKYSLFDPTKEMAYIPLDDELKTKGKAAVDVIGGRAGKAGGAFVQSTLLAMMATTNVLSIAHISFFVFFIVALAWVVSVRFLSVRVKKWTDKRIAEDKLKKQQS